MINVEDILNVGKNLNEFIFGGRSLPNVKTDFAAKFFGMDKVNDLKS